MREEKSIETDVVKSHRRLEWLTKRRIIAASLAVVVLSQNVDAIYDGYSYKFAGGSMVPEVSGCEYEAPEVSLPPTVTILEVPTTTEPTNETTTITTPPTTNPTSEFELSALDERSSSENNRALEMLKNIIPHYKQNSKQYDNLEHVFMSRHSGIIFEIYGTEEESERDIDYEAFDDLYHLSVTTEIKHANSEIQYVTDCVSKKVLEDKILAGERVKVLIPNTNDYCISNLLLIKVENRYKNDCTQSAAGLPKIEIEFLFWKPYSEQHFILTAGNINADTVEELNEKFNIYVVHEGAHRIQFDLGVTPREHQDEKFAGYLETATVNEFIPKVLGPPAPAGFAKVLPQVQEEQPPDIPFAVKFQTVD